MKVIAIIMFLSLGFSQADTHITTERIWHKSEGPEMLYKAISNGIEWSDTVLINVGDDYTGFEEVRFLGIDTYNMRLYFNLLKIESEGYGPLTSIHRRNDGKYTFTINW
ncbi:hypothetical protein HOE31_01575 [bacterium]|jgi:hypothetical protein|nr:hypothetical protein [bacterium]MBT4121619.1 hypothetical protein [bacterium]MBT4335116.1 hypothetical protein [bacterium]MBT4495279.1 hypothetical protein [bacterium]MBT4763903.1 hypothetical protein [bacterium]